MNFKKIKENFKTTVELAKDSVSAVFEKEEKQVKNEGEAIPETKPLIDMEKVKEDFSKVSSALSGVIIAGISAGVCKYLEKNGQELAEKIAKTVSKGSK